MLRRVEPQEEVACPFGECDGSTWVLDEETGDARPCRCREQRVRQAVSGGIGTGIGRRFLEVSFDREPIVSLDPVVLRQVRSFLRSIEDNLEAGRGLWFDGPVGTGKTSLAILVAKAAKDAGRSYAVYPVPRLLAEIKRTFDRDARRQLPRLLPPPLHRRRARARRPRRGEADRVGARAALLDRQRALAGPPLDRGDHEHPRPGPRRPRPPAPGERARPARGGDPRRRPRRRGAAHAGGPRRAGGEPASPSSTSPTATTRSCGCGARSARAPSRASSRSATTRSRSWARTCAWLRRAPSRKRPARPAARGVASERLHSRGQWQAW